MRSLSTCVVALAFAALVCVSSSAFSGIVLFQDSFEGDTVGAALGTVTPSVGQNYTTNVDDALIANVTTQPGPGAGNSGKFVAINTAVGLNARAYLTAEGQAASAGEVVTFKGNMYVAAGSGRALDIATYADLPSFAGNVFDWSVYKNGTVTYYNTGDTVKQTATGTFTTGAWVPFQVVADYTAKTYSVNVGGVTFSDVFNTASTNSVPGLFLSCPTTGVALDNLAITIGQVPEPSSLLVLVSGVVGLLAYAWKKRR
jgi:hypothetical protein